MSAHTDVLIVGGGPVGLAFACELTRHGVSCRIVDKNAAPQVWSKAAAVTPRTLEVLTDMGVAEALLERGRPMHGFNIMDGTRRLAHVPIQLEGTPYPYLFGVPQRDTEVTLAARLAGLGVTFEREVELTSFEQDGGGVRATLRHAGGSEETATARWLVGCDGAHSTVRKSLGLSFEGSTFEQTLWQADIHVDFPFDVDPSEAYAFPSRNGVMGALPLLADGRYRLIILAPPNPEEEPTLEGMQAIAAERMPEGTELRDPAWIVAFRFHGRLASRYRVGNVFLAGDAGHIHSPVGGQGMNMGIQDAYNLAWKLALVSKGAATDALLDSYEPERRPVAAGVVSGTDRATRGMARVLQLRSPLAAHLRSQVISLVADLGLVQSQLIGALSGVRVGYPDSPIVGERHSSIWKAEVGSPRGEQPGLGDWMRFSSGPGPGERVPDVELWDGAPAPTLHALLSGTRHVLLLFDGAAATPEGYENLTSIARAVDESLLDHVRVLFVVPHAQRPPALASGSDVLLDADGALHAHFGCGTEGLYLIRPDGYVGFRTQPADQTALFEYLKTIFSPLLG
jgi:2-polyprenyl-6-methoxyphenol hydroxylase-like FAD-dependent oxidoreductase